jgi:hypothetical protein
MLRKCTFCSVEESRDFQINLSAYFSHSTRPFLSQYTAPGPMLTFPWLSNRYRTSISCPLTKKAELPLSLSSMAARRLRRGKYGCSKWRPQISDLGDKKGMTPVVQDFAFSTVPASSVPSFLHAHTDCMCWLSEPVWRPGYWLDGRSSVVSRGKRIFFSPQGPFGLWQSLSLLYDGCQGFYPKVEAAGVWTDHSPFQQGLNLIISCEIYMRNIGTFNFKTHFEPL